MLTLATRIKLAVFAVIAVAVIIFTGLHYADVGRYVGLRGYYVVTMDMPDGGGIFTNADVTYRGVPVGRVGAMSITGNGIQVDLDISDSAPKIPSHVKAAVADLSVVGEQYVDLRPTASGGPYLTAGTVIPAQDTSTPPSTTSMLAAIDNFVNSVPTQSLRTVVNEFGKAFQGQGPNLQTLLDASSNFTKAANADLPQSTSLIDEGKTVLTTQNQESTELESFASSINLLAQQMDASNGSLNNLIDVTPDAATQTKGLLDDNTPSLGEVFANLLTLSEVSSTRTSNLEELLSVLPADIAAASTAITTKGANFGLALDFFSPLPCTAGYGGTTYRNGLDTSAAPPLNTGAGCTEPASQGEVRGPAHAPSGGEVPPAAKAPK
jgi:phospholipid/cholesterol/gamma-HCH transport system substrate-binding protein